MNVRVNGVLQQSRMDGWMDGQYQKFKLTYNERLDYNKPRPQKEMKFCYQRQHNERHEGDVGGICAMVCLPGTHTLRLWLCANVYLYIVISREHLHASPLIPPLNRRYTDMWTHIVAHTVLHVL